MADSTAIKFTKHQIAGLAHNLTMLLNKSRMTENALALALNLPSMTIRRLASGETGDPHISTLKKIADYFNVSIDALIEEANTTGFMHKSNTPAFVPVLDWSTASEINSLHDINLSAWPEWQPVVLGPHSILSKDAFALESRPSMAPRFPIGTLFIIDPKAELMDSDLVLMKVKKDAGLSIREISIDPPKWLLRPTISGSETFFYDASEHHIVGPVLLTLLYSRR